MKTTTLTPTCSPLAVNPLSGPTQPLLDLREPLVGPGGYFFSPSGSLYSPSGQWWRYLTTAGTALAAQPAAHAAIVYYDPTDVTISTGSTQYANFATGTFSGTAVGLGINNGSGDYVRVVTGGGQIAGIAVSNYPTTYKPATKFTLGQSIGSGGGSAGFSTGLVYFDNQSYAGLPWNSGVNGTTGYIGVKITLSSQTYYGWVGVTYNDVANTVVLKDFAYDNTPNTAIAAGAVPEPHSAVLLAMGAAGVLAQRRRKLALAVASGAREDTGSA